MIERYGLVIAPRAARAISDELPEQVAWAVIELITGQLLDNPHRLGHQLANELTGTWSARRGDYRLLYAIDEATHEVTVLRVEHRRDVYRT